MSARLEPAEAWELLDRLGAAYVLLAEVAAGAAAPRGLTLSQLVALAVLAAAPPGGLSQSEWGRLQGVSRQRAHVVTNALLEAGLCAVERRGRASFVTMTPAGRRLTSKLRREVGAAVSGALSGTEVEALRGVSRGLSRLLGGLELPWPLP